MVQLDKANQENKLLEKAVKKGVWQNYRGNIKAKYLVLTLKK